MKIRQIALCLAVSLASAGAWAKLPPPSEEAKAKAEEAKVAAAEKAKVDAEQLGKAQDRVANQYIKDQKAKGVIVKPTPIPPPTPPAAAPAAPAAAPPVAAAAPAPTPAAPAPAAKK